MLWKMTSVLLANKHLPRASCGQSTALGTVGDAVRRGREWERMLTTWDALDRRLSRGSLLTC